MRQSRAHNVAPHGHARFSHHVFRATFFRAIAIFFAPFARAKFARQSAKLSCHLAPDFGGRKTLSRSVDRDLSRGTAMTSLRT
eukprot:6185685-Pleurochrysis_carterae.AAC.1